MFVLWKYRATFLAFCARHGVSEEHVWASRGFSATAELLISLLLCSFCASYYFNPVKLLWTNYSSQWPTYLTAVPEVRNASYIRQVRVYRCSVFIMKAVLQYAALITGYGLDWTPLLQCVGRPYKHFPVGISGGLSFISSTQRGHAAILATADHRWSGDMQLVTTTLLLVGISERY